MKHATLSVLLLAAALSVNGEHRRDPNYERVLVPVFFFGGGAAGAQWATNVDVVNTGNAFDMGHSVVGENAPDTVCDSERHLPSRNAEQICANYQHAAGIILYIPRNVAYQNVHVGARVLDRSRSSDRYGTAIPVVWERDLLHSPMVLLDVPTGDRRYRASLRLYDVYQWNTQFTIRFYDMAALRRGVSAPMFTTQVTAVWDFDSDDAGRPMRPSFAMIGDLVAAYPQLAAAQSVAIEVTGANVASGQDQPEDRLYALASITNNTTQEVTIVAPK